MNDRAMELPPLNQFLARRLIERARVAETLGEWRGAAPVNMEALEQVLLRVSEMVCELPQLREMDINPIIVDESGAVAVDARIVVDNAAPSARNYSHLAILPYPAQYAQVWPLRGGGRARPPGRPAPRSGLPRSSFHDGAMPRHGQAPRPGRRSVPPLRSCAPLPRSTVRLCPRAAGSATSADPDASAAILRATKATKYHMNMNKAQIQT